MNEILLQSLKGVCDPERLRASMQVIAGPDREDSCGELPPRPPLSHCAMGEGPKQSRPEEAQQQGQGSDHDLGWGFQKARHLCLFSLLVANIFLIYMLFHCAHL